MNVRRLARSKLGALVALAVLAFSASASADSQLALDLDYTKPIDAPAIDGGVGGAIRYGYQYRAPMVAVTPELAVAYHKFGGDFSPTVLRGLVGLRLGVGEIIRPGVYAHFGYGHLGYSNIPAEVDDPSRNATSYDLGAFLDLTVLPVIDIGIHGAYNAFAAGDGRSKLEFATLGAHLALLF